MSKKGRIFQLIQGPLVAVVLGILFFVFTLNHSTLSIGTSHLVNVPIPNSVSDFLDQFSSPNFSVITNYKVWVTAFTIAVVASIETLLSVEATDKLDPEKNVTPTNRELIAQGTGNMISGLIGGLPVTQVIVRSSANIQSSAKSKLSTIIHGFLLLLSVILIPTLLNKIPLSVLAAVLLIVGYKLANPSLFSKMYKLGWKQFIPFIITVLGIVFTDLLIGVGLGLAAGLVVIAIKSYQNSHFLHKEQVSNDNLTVKMTLAEEVTFLNKAAIQSELFSLPENSRLNLDIRKTVFLDYDIVEILDNFLIQAKNKNIWVHIQSERGDVDNIESFTNFLKLEKIKTNGSN